MRASWPVVLSAFVLSTAPACGGDDEGVDLAGDTPAEAADDIATATCDREIECGGWHYDLEYDGGEVIACTPTQELDRDACISEARAEIRADLECAEPTDEELGQIADCINDTVAQDCLTEADIRSFCDAVVAGEEPDPPGEVPSSCDVLDTILEGCEDI